MTVVETDIAIVGAGPIGLFATYYAGFRGLRVALIDSLPELGGQITAMYPEKQLHDVAGFPSVKGRALVAGLVAQAESAHPVHLLGRTATALEESVDGLSLHLSDGTLVETHTLLVTAGIGRFSPRPLPVGEEWVGRGIEYFVPDFEPYRDKDVVVVGGGDSAFDWAEQLEPLARTVTLVHRRDSFRAHARTVAKVLASSVQVLTNAQLVEVRGTDRVESLAVRVTGEAETRVLPCQSVVAALGFVADLGPLQEWGLETDKRHVVVDQAMRTSRARVFAAGDVAEYPGKVRLIAVGFGEAATAVNHAAVVVDPGRRVFPGHSSEEDESLR
ncbi:NAD(P)/FAD-dependent oxidoreductase [Nocardioides gilvus]|uniref:NAD(P)/FAD-dependent oxidoreductase n=1 Tax=Nocardioides gilvus TaxID=1735589 RepID=UPI000D74CB73|nr:NAD(P)/FAD-dependent oxidoreductase [Nocardioides gilvus]